MKIDTPGQMGLVGHCKGCGFYSEHDLESGGFCARGTHDLLYILSCLFCLLSHGSVLMKEAEASLWAPYVVQAGHMLAWPW